jgi:ATP-binding cassette, subfamily B, bacterial
LVAKPPILCLDEATSALDPFSGSAIDELLHNLAGQHTIISITHRLSSAVKADQIVVLDKGTRVESGSHQELIELNGLYKRLWDKQQGFIIDKFTQEISIIPEWLKHIPLFSSLEDKTLSKLANQFELQRSEPGQIIVRQGESGEKFYVLVAGTVEVLSKVRNEEESRALLSDGDYFGEIALLFDAPRNATVRIKTITVYLSLDYHKFHKIFNELPDALRSNLYAKARERFSPEQLQSNPIARFDPNPCT